MSFQSDRTYNAEASDSTDSVAGRDRLSNGTAYLYEQFATGQLAALLQDGFAYDVGVLNLTKYEGVGGDSLGSSYGTLRQDQLVYWGPQSSTIIRPVPDGGTTLLLLGSALGGLGLLRRWSQQAKA